MFLLVLVGLMWGMTNPFIKTGSKGFSEIKANSKLQQIVLEIKFLLLNWKVSNL